MGHLVKVLSDTNENSAGNLEGITALKFMIKVYHDQQKKESDILHEIGVHNVSESHLQCLEDLPLVATYDCLQLFIHWVEVGYYDFNMIPGQLKAHMIPDDKLALEQLHKNWSGKIHDLKKELNELIDALKLCEGDITSQVNDDVSVLLSTIP